MLSAAMTSCEKAEEWQMALSLLVAWRFKRGVNLAVLPGAKDLLAKCLRGFWSTVF